MQPSRTKQGRVSALDGLGNPRVGGVDQLAHLAAEGVLPAGQGIDTGTDARAGGLCHRASAPCQHRQGTSQPHAMARRESMAHGSGEHANAAHLTPSDPPTVSVRRQIRNTRRGPREPGDGAHNRRT